MTLGWTYFISMLATAVIVAVIYSAAQDAFLPASGVVRQTLRRLGKLVGVLLGLAVLVYVLGKI